MLGSMLEEHRTYRIAHPPMRHHVVRELCRLTQVILRARRRLAEHASLRGVAAHEYAQLALELRARRNVAIFPRPLPRRAERQTARDDGDPLDGLRARAELRD